MLKKALLTLGLLSLCFTATSTFAVKSKGNVACPVDSPYEDANGPLTFQDMFGEDVLDKMRCNERRSKVKMVMQVNLYEQGDNPYGFRNLQNIINDFEITHGIKNWKIAVVVHSGGWRLVVNNSVENAYIDVVEKFIANPNVDVYYCLNTAAARGHTTGDIIEGVKFVPAGLSSIMDFQYQGYKYIQP